MRIKPILLPSLLAGVLAMPGAAMALGLGRLTVQSSLGQPLSARIELTSATKEELDSLAARIAEPSLYRQNNLSYQGVLARSRVTIERNPNGQAFLNVSTQGALTEPYLDLMVELNWASGRLVREYTFLLDPPGVTAPPVEPVAPIRAGAAPQPPAPVVPPVSAAPAPVAVPAPRAAAPARAPSASGTYAVQRGDTLSKIAAEHKPQNVTLEQMLIAMYKNNQDAFDGNNINRLKAGSILKIPTTEEVASTAPNEATQLVRVHSSDWNAYRNRVASVAPQTDSGASRTSSGRIGAAVQEATPAAPPGRDQLRVSRAPEAASGPNASAEEAIARSRQIKEAQDRIAELERTVRDLQRAAELKSEALAMLQAQAEAAKGGAAKSATPAATDIKAGDTKAAEPKAADTAKGPSTAPGGATKAGEPAKGPEVMKAEEAAKAPDATAAAKTDDAAKAAAAKAAAKADEPPKAVTTAALKTDAALSPPKAEPSLLDDLMTRTPTWAIGAGALAVLGGIAALLAARRRKNVPYEEPMTTDTDLKSTTVFGSTGGGVVNTGDNSLSSEFSREGISAIDTDEVDPIAEAEVYLAYGRDAQAEEILKDALKKDPQRQEIHLKLLEIHAQHNKPSAFDAVAVDLRNVSHGQGEIWQKAVTLGRQLDPANPMFAEPLTQSDVDRFSASDLPPSAPRAVPADNMFDRALEQDIAVSPPSAKTDFAGRPAAGTGSSTSIAAATAQLAGGIGKAGATAQGADAGFLSDLEFHLDDVDKPAPVQSATSAPASAAAKGQPPAKSSAAQSSMPDKLDFTFDDNASVFGDPSPSAMDGQWHDSATKLDLAKAYQEMGDVEGAREILREVLAEGDDNQKTEARTLIAKLG